MLNKYLLNTGIYTNAGMKKLFAKVNNLLLGIINGKLYIKKYRICTEIFSNIKLFVRALETGIKRDPASE